MKRKMYKVIQSPPGWTEEIDDCPDTSYLEQEGFEDRLKAFERGEFCFTGIRASAVIVLGIDKETMHMHTLQSPGVWGIESDMPDQEKLGIAMEEEESLWQDLEALGFKRPKGQSLKR